MTKSTEMPDITFDTLLFVINVLVHERQLDVFKLYHNDDDDTWQILFWADEQGPLITSEMLPFAGLIAYLQQYPTVEQPDA